MFITSNQIETYVLERFNTESYDQFVIVFFKKSL